MRTMLPVTQLFFFLSLFFFFFLLLFLLAAFPLIQSDSRKAEITERYGEMCYTHACSQTTVCYSMETKPCCGNDRAFVDDGKIDGCVPFIHFKVLPYGLCVFVWTDHWMHRRMGSERHEALGPEILYNHRSPNQFWEQTICKSNSDESRRYETKWADLELKSGPENRRQKRYKSNAIKETMWYKVSELKKHWEKSK